MMNTSAALASQDILKPLPFDATKLSGLSERLIRSHWENNYGGSVKALAHVKARLAQALADKDLPPYIYNDLKREHLIRTGSVVLHECPSHTYQIDYGAAAVRYIDAFFQNLQWEAVAARLVDAKAY